MKQAYYAFHDAALSEQVSRRAEVGFFPDCPRVLGTHNHRLAHIIVDGLDMHHRAVVSGGLDLDLGTHGECTRPSDLRHVYGGGRDATCTHTFWAETSEVLQNGHHTRHWHRLALSARLTCLPFLC